MASRSRADTAFNPKRLTQALADTLNKCTGGVQGASWMRTPTVHAGENEANLNQQRGIGLTLGVLSVLILRIVKNGSEYQGRLP